MATRSTISVLQKDGSVKSIYCHFDGYIKGVGRTLQNYYNSEELANRLVSLGDLSYLSKYPDPLPEAPEEYHFGRTPGIIKAEDHSFDNPQKDVTVAYHRDRRENFNINNYSSIEEYIISKNFQDYNYLWMNGEWHLKNKSELVLY